MNLKYGRLTNTDSPEILEDWNLQAEQLATAGEEVPEGWNFEVIQLATTDDPTVPYGWNWEAVKLQKGHQVPLHRQHSATHSHVPDHPPKSSLLTISL